MVSPARSTGNPEQDRINMEAVNRLNEEMYGSNSYSVPADPNGPFTAMDARKAQMEAQQKAQRLLAPNSEGYYNRDGTTANPVNLYTNPAGNPANNESMRNVTAQDLQQAANFKNATFDGLSNTQAMQYEQAPDLRNAQSNSYSVYDKRMAEVRPAMNQAVQNSPEFKAKEAFLQTFAGREPTQAEIEQFKKLDIADKNSPARQKFVDFQQNLMQSLGISNSYSVPADPNGPFTGRPFPPSTPQPVAPTGNPTPMQDKLDTLNQELADLYAMDQTDPATIKAIEDKTKEQQAAGAAAMTEGQQNLVSTAVKSPEQLATQTNVATVDPNTVGTTIAPGLGDAGATGGATPTITGEGQQAVTPDAMTPASVQATTTQGAVDTALGGVDAAQGTVSTTVDAATKDPTTVAGTDLDVDQIANATQVVKPDARKVETGELLDGSAVNMAAVKEATEFEAAQADPSKQATVKGQLDDLMDDFDDGATPAWAAGAMRAATAAMAARGLGSSSMAGQAIVQAAMESALPIAQQDAQTTAAFEAANLSNRQQTALFAAQQRADFLKLDFNQEFQSRVANAAKISDIANMNFTAEQQVALENARMAQTVDITNLNAKNAKIMANAAAMANMDMANLSNQQQARVENAKSFLQMDLTNLNNAQQVEIFKANSVQQAILSDAAADNAAKQFNASSVNQTNQFMADLESRTSQFNAAQSNALEQFNVGEVNAISKFNEEQNNAREEFNTKNALLIAQANAQWRQATTTTNTAAQNEANMQDAKAMNAFTASTLDQVWQRERDLLSYSWQTSNNALERINNVILANIQATSSANNNAATNAANTKQAESNMWGNIGAAVVGFDWSKG